jgi:hypothetical protein
MFEDLGRGALWVGMRLGGIGYENLEGGKAGFEEWECNGWGNSVWLIEEVRIWVRWVLVCNHIVLRWASRVMWIIRDEWYGLYGLIMQGAYGGQLST